MKKCIVHLQAEMHCNMMLRIVMRRCRMHRYVTAPMFTYLELSRADQRQNSGARSVK